MSKDPIPLSRAKAQIRALYASENRKMKGGIIDRATFEQRRSRGVYNKDMSYEDFARISGESEAATQQSLADLAVEQEEYAADPSRHLVKCPYTATGDVGNTTMSRAECEAARGEWERKNHPENYYFFRPAVSALTTAADIGASVLENVPGVGKIASKVYQGFAPPGSAYYTQSSLGEKAVGTAASLFGLGSKSRRRLRGGIRITPERISALMTTATGAALIGTLFRFIPDDTTATLASIFLTGFAAPTVGYLSYKLSKWVRDKIINRQQANDILQAVQEGNLEISPIDRMTALFALMMSRLDDESDAGTINSEQYRERGVELMRAREAIERGEEPELPEWMEDLVREDVAVDVAPAAAAPAVVPSIYAAAIGSPRGDEPVAINVAPSAEEARVFENPMNVRRGRGRRQRKTREEMEGAGIFGDIWSGVKKYTGRVVDVIRHGKRQDYPPAVRDLLSRIGNQPIVAARLRRDPIKAPLNIALNLITKGSWEQAKRKYAYDKLFHLGLEVTVRVADSTASNGVYIIEKNEVINVARANPVTADTETLPVDVRAGATINSLLNGAKKVQGTAYFEYDAFRNNCQDFIVAVLNGSGLATPKNTAWVKQPIDNVIAELPSYTSRIAKFATDIGALANVVTQGRGKRGGLKPLAPCEGEAHTGEGHSMSSPRSRFAKQLRAAGVSPNAYLMEAQQKAKDAGLAWEMLGFSSDDKHKLQIPNHNGTIVRFGAVGLGDHILYTLSGDPKADEHQRRYLARATKIRGKWREDEYSPNSLAIVVLW